MVDDDNKVVVEHNIVDSMEQLQGAGLMVAYVEDVLVEEASVDDKIELHQLAVAQGVWLQAAAQVEWAWIVELYLFVFVGGAWLQ